MQDAKQTCQQKPISCFNELVSQREGRSQSFGVEERTHPRRNGPKVLMMDPTCCRAPPQFEPVQCALNGQRSAKLCPRQEHAIRADVASQHPASGKSSFERNDSASAERVDDQMASGGIL
jgi:hypothetical protein